MLIQSMMEKYMECQKPQMIFDIVAACWIVALSSGMLSKIFSYS